MALDGVWYTRSVVVPNVNNHPSVNQAQVYQQHIVRCLAASRVFVEIDARYGDVQDNRPCADRVELAATGHRR